MGSLFRLPAARLFCGDQLFEQGLDRALPALFPVGARIPLQRLAGKPGKVLQKALPDAIHRYGKRELFQGSMPRRDIGEKLVDI